ncbi:MAG: ABC transporter permease [Eubacterium sp.]|nr:ABC transporter permease [Eubacterium sp.]
MLQLLNAEFYKLRKSKSFFICTILTVVFVFIMYGAFLLADNIQKGKVENGTGGVIVSINQEELQATSASIWDTIHIMDILQEIFSGDVMAMIIGTFISIFVISEFMSGMLKNVVGKGSSRASIYLSKLFAAMFAAVLMAAVGIIATLICGRIFIGASAFAGDFWKNLMIYTALQLVMTTTVASIFVLIGELFRNLAAGISIGIGVAVFPTLLLNFIDMKFADSSILPSQLWPFTRMFGCPFEGFTVSYAAETLLVAAFWLVLTAGLGIWHFSRTDIK